MTWHLVTTDFPPLDGGIATWSEAVADALHAGGEEVIVHARNGEPGRHDYRVVRMRGRSWARWGAVWAAVSVVPRLRPGDRVLCATWPLAVRLLGRRVPVLVSWHGSDLTRPALAAGFEAVRAGAVHVPVSAFLGRLLGAPHTVLPAPIAPAPPARRGEALLVVARLVGSKGVDRALRLAARLGRPAVVVGDGPERRDLEALAASLATPVRFLGRRPPGEIPWDGTWALALLSRADSEASPGPTGGRGEEGLGLVLLEAAARGIPSIGSAVGGIPEAASVVLIDPEHDPVPPLPTPGALQAWLAARHGPARTASVLRERALAWEESAKLRC